MKKGILGSAVFFALVSSVWADLGTELVAKGLERPVWVGAPDGVKGKLWVMEQAGTVWIYDLETGKKSKEPFLEIEERVERKGNEQGLLGLAFAPDFPKTGKYYVNFTDKDKHTQIVRFVSKDGVTTEDEGETILEYGQDFGNHNGGWLDFGPDGMLYIATGDGGSANDPKNRSQDMSSLLGKLLRIDVSGERGYLIPEDNAFVGKTDVMPEIHASGLRNPWRCSFDRVTDDFWIGDVGQNAFEEIDMVKAGELGGQNFGWKLREGEIKTPPRKFKKVGGEIPQNHHEPIYVYKHGGGATEGQSVTGGFVYRGTAVPELKGRYIFADYQNPRIWSFEEKSGKAADFTDHTSEMQPEGGRISLISSFGEDATGEVYLTDLTGSVYRIVAK
ncbi:MAG: PQQ-dependent sugar dehydrogenase [Luteolibacter sp.]